MLDANRHFASQNHRLLIAMSFCTIVRMFVKHTPLMIRLHSGSDQSEGHPQRMTEAMQLGNLPKMRRDLLRRQTAPRNRILQQFPRFVPVPNSQYRGGPLAG